MSNNLFITECIHYLDKKVIGHNQAKQAIAQTLFGLQNPLRKKGVLGVIYLNGPTGVGKDELIKATAEFLFNNSSMYTNIPFEAITSKRSLFGADPSTIGYDDSVGLHQRRIFSHYKGDISTFHPSVQKKQAAVISISEIDKGKNVGNNENIIQSLLTVLSDGKASMSDATITDLSNCLIIITGNTGMEESTKQIGYNKSTEATGKLIKGKINNLLSPEFMGRIDYFIQLESLTTEEYSKIIKLQLGNTQTKITHLFGSKVSISGLTDQKVIDHILKNIDKEKGARDIEDFIYDHIGTPLGAIIVQTLDNLKENDTLNISLSIQNDTITIKNSIKDMGVPTSLGEYGKEMEEKASSDPRKTAVEEILVEVLNKLESLKTSNRRLWLLVILLVGFISYKEYNKEKPVDPVIIYQKAYEDAIKALQQNK